MRWPDTGNGIDGRSQAAVLVRCMHAGPVDNSISVERLNGMHSPALWTEAECSVTRIASDSRQCWKSAATPEDLGVWSRSIDLRVFSSHHTFEFRIKGPFTSSRTEFRSGADKNGGTLA
jgi:hypothetical protein